MNPQPHSGVTSVEWRDNVIVGANAENQSGFVMLRNGIIESEVIKPPYRPGETVYIKEAWAHHRMFEKEKVVGRGLLIYKADGAEYRPIIRWRSPCFMPEWASRSHARIVSVRPERVREITEEEAKHEGMTPYMGWNDISHNNQPYYVIVFKDLWEKLHPGSWDRNDWVWRIELEKK